MTAQFPLWFGVLQ